MARKPRPWAAGVPRSASTRPGPGPTRYAFAMCRSIRPLRGRAAPPATEGDVRDAARQYVRKVAAMRPAARDAAAFEAAVDEIAAATTRVLAAMGSPPVPGPATPPSAWPARPGRPRPARA